MADKNNKSCKNDLNLENNLKKNYKNKTKTTNEIIDKKSCNGITSQIEHLMKEEIVNLKSELTCLKEETNKIKKQLQLKIENLLEKNQKLEKINLSINKGN